MPKTYFNDAVIGNSSALACLTGNGELVRLFWPHIDHPQHVERFYCGLHLDGISGFTSWFHQESWEKDQSYVEDTNILDTVYKSREWDIHVRQVDFFMPEADVLVRSYTIQNSGSSAKNVSFVLFSEFVSNLSDMQGTLFDFHHDALVHYRPGNYFAVAGDGEVHGFQVGDCAFEAACSNSLYGINETVMAADGALAWRLGELRTGESKTFNIYVCAGDTLKKAFGLLRETRGRKAEDLIEETRGYWHGFLQKARRPHADDSEIKNLYNRSLLVFGLMWDKKTGGILAAPELDEGFTRCGRYAYCWGRDAAFITTAMDKAGLHHEVDKFYDWVLNTQMEDGSWLQRYHVDGNLAPSWGLQIDETGSILTGILGHYHETGDIDFLHKMWNCVKKAADFLVFFRDSETGLPKPSYDIWEERWGEHAYSAAAVYAGLAGAAEIADILVRDKKGLNGIRNVIGMNEKSFCRQKWLGAAREIKRAILSVMWDDEKCTFNRSVRVKLNPWGNEPASRPVRMVVNRKGYVRELTPADGTPDISLLGLSVPFGVLPARDERMLKTADMIRGSLHCPGAGGLKRYENDGYMGGNPWIIAALWMALYEIEAGEYRRAEEYLKWALGCRTRLGLLPEQADKDTGKPAWVIPLTWSHAMFVLVLLVLEEKEKI